MILWVLKSVILFALALAAAFLMRRRSPAVRHLLWAATFLTVAGLPLLQGRFDGARIPVTAPISLPTAHASSVSIPAVADSTLPRRSSPFSAVPLNVLTPSSQSVREALPAPIPASALPSVRASLVNLYGLGLALCAIFYGISGARLARALRHSRRFEGASGAPCPVRVSSHIPVPVTFGWLNPVILLPEEVGTWSESRLRMVIAHETAHVRRGDWAWQTLALVVCIAQWFNPLAWVAVRRLRAEAEGAADDSVLRTGVSASEYAHELLEIVSDRRRAGLVTVPMARPEGMNARVRNVLATDRDRKAPSRRAAITSFNLTLASTLLLGCIGFQEVVQSKPPANDPPPNLERNNPFQTTPSGEFVIKRNEFLKLVCVQLRERRGFAAWNGTGRPVKSPFSKVPQIVTTADRKVRDIVILHPKDVRIEVLMPEGVNILEVLRQPARDFEVYGQPPTSGYTLVRATFPKEMRTTRVMIRQPSNRKEFYVFDQVLLDPAAPIAVNPKAAVPEQVLKDGTRLRLVSIEDVQDGKPGRVWGADGKPASAPYKDFGHTISRPKTPGMEMRSLSMEISVPARKATLPLDIVCQISGQTETLTFVAAELVENKPFTTRMKGIFLVPVGKKSADFEFRTSFKEWEAETEEELGGSQLKATLERSPAAGQTFVRIAADKMPSMRETRFEAIDKDGKVLAACNGLRSSPNANEPLTLTLQFPLKPEQEIAKLRVSHRIHDQATFKNVALQPAL